MTDTSDFPQSCQSQLELALRPTLFKALCDPVRVSIVATLATRKTPTSVSDIAACCGIDFSGVSRHLKILREANVLSDTKHGRTRLYQLNAHTFIENLRGMADAVELCIREAK